MVPLSSAAARLRGGGASSFSAAMVLFLCLAPTLSAAMTTEVGAGENFVVTEDIAPGELLDFQFALHPDFLFPISIRDESANTELMHWNDFAYGVYTVPASDKPRTITISFDNSNTLFTSKNVNFDIRTSMDVNYAVDASKIDPIEQKIRTLSSSMQRLKNLQVSIRNQQKDHRTTVERANERVLLWSLFQVMAFVMMLSFQLWMLKRLLEKKTYV
ncbi:hypothetical protein LSCM1_01407 [Leishmania martiniquensis]|uniref:GOLD domain-containing protein n=1 Tax=Leishmania martiniquensis TaxID=1580590 RepID=A0A836H763_9TRYP|nr:hypothetical protein LSCM1_01407 [Leishmania martiniquensis]